MIGAAEALAGPASSTTPEQAPLQLTPNDAAQESADSQEDDIWGNLPKPWEPLPAWMTDPVPPSGISFSNTFPASWDAPPTNGTSSTPTVAAPTANGAASGVQMAELGRDVQPQMQVAQSAPHDAAAQVPPDLDALAQQVYTILRRRISAESRRFR